jgi:hypothetical protein
VPVCRSDACAPDEPFEVRGIRRNGAGAGIVQSPATGQASGRRAARDATVHAVRIISRGLSRNLPPVLGIVRGGRPLSVIRWLATVRVISDDGSGGTEPRCLAGHSLLSDARFQVLCSPIGPYPRSADLPVRKRGDLRATLDATELKPRQDPLDESWHGKALPAPSLRLGTSDPPGAALSPIYSARYRARVTRRDQVNDRLPPLPIMARLVARIGAPTLEDYRRAYAGCGAPWPGDDEIRRRHPVAADPAA